MGKLISITIPLFILMDFIGTMPVFLSLTKDVNQKEKIKTAIFSSLIAGAIVLGFAILGNSIMSYFDLSIEAIEVGGGLLLLYIAFDMILSGQLGYQKVKDIKSVVVSPLAIPMLAGPGSMSYGMIKFMGAQGIDKLWVIVAIFITVVSGALILSISSFVQKLLGQEFVRGLEKVTAVIVSFIAMEMIMSGIKAYFFQ